MAENYTGLEALAIANAKGEIRKAKAKMKEINDKRDERVRLERIAREKAILEERKAKWASDAAQRKMENARRDFTAGIEALTRDLKRTAPVYRMQITDPIRVAKDADTASITISAQRMP